MADDATRICDQPGCIAAVIRRDDGSRVCARDHASRWVDAAGLDAARARIAALEAALREDSAVARLLYDVIDTFDVCDASRGWFSCHEEHDCRCPKGRTDTPEKWNGEWICECGAESFRAALDAARALRLDRRTSGAEEIASLTAERDALAAENHALRAALESLLSVPYVLDSATVPRGGVDVAPKQVVGNLCVALVRYRAAQAILATPPSAPAERVARLVAALPVIRWVLMRVGSWTCARWDQHARDEFGDARVDPVVAALAEWER